jgi:hypothetical protein
MVSFFYSMSTTAWLPCDVMHARPALQPPLIPPQVLLHATLQRKALQRVQAFFCGSHGLSAKAAMRSLATSARSVNRTSRPLALKPKIKVSLGRKGRSSRGALFECCCSGCTTK